LDPTAVAENRIAGGVGEVTGAIPLPRPDLPLRFLYSFNDWNSAETNAEIECLFAGTSDASVA